MLKKSCAIILSIALAMGILVHGSFAFVVPTQVVSIGEFLDSLSDTFTPTCLEDVRNGFESYLPSYPYVAIRTQSDSQGVYYVNVFICTTTFIFATNYPYVPTSTAYFRVLAFNRNTLHVNFSNSTQPQQMISPNHMYWCNEYWDMSPTDAFYSSIDTSFNGISVTANLSTSLLPPDSRILEVYKSDAYLDFTPYLAVRVDDVPDSYMWISVRFHDEYGNGTEIFDIYDLEYYPGDDYQLYLINPMKISSKEFTVTSVVYSGSLEWGYKEVDGLDIVFNEQLLPDPLPSITPDPTYNYDYTSIINYNGGDKDVFYNSFKVNIARYEGQSSDYYFKDSYNYLVQPFAFNFILLPYYPVQQGFVYDAFIDDCFYQYDVILSEYYDAYFDFFYGSGALTSLQTALSSFQAGSDISQALETWYSSHSPVVYTFPYTDSSDLTHLSSDMPALLVVTDSFYFKQTNYLLGDTGDILSEFSDRFYKVGGFSDTLFSNILASYNSDLAFYNEVLPILTSLSYWTNGLNINENFNSCINLLTSIDGYISSVDTKLDLLSTIDTDIGDLLEWFQNQEDSDVTLTLPDFDSSILINIYGANIGDFVEFVHDFVNVLPEFDFSDFPNFFDYAADLVDDTAGSGDDLIGSLFNPYDYDDSGLHDFGWD